MCGNHRSSCVCPASRGWRLRLQQRSRWPSSGRAVVAVDRSAAGTIYKGLALSGDRLYATDFHNGRVDVFDGSFKPVGTPGAFVDRKLARAFAPFGIQAAGSRIFVTFAKQDAGARMTTSTGRVSASSMPSTVTAGCLPGSRAAAS
jgi:uncharacterized protein (TIGR03118 family)